MKFKKSFYTFTRKELNLQNLEIQAYKMKSISERKFCEGKIRQSVKLKILDLDRA